MKGIVAIVFIFYSSFAFGQTVEKSNKTYLLPVEFVKNPILKTPSFKIDSSQVNNNSLSILLNDNYKTPMVEYNTTIFCKFEHKLMMSSRLPLKMRIGDVQYVDRLEGKK